MRLKARSGAGGRQGYGQANRTVRNAKETAQERALWVVRQLIEAGLPPTLPDEYLAIVQLINDYQRVAKPDKVCQNRKSVRRGDGDKESFVGKVYLRVATPSAKKRDQPKTHPSA